MFDPGFKNTHDDHCRDCMPHDVPAGTTVICAHRNHHHAAKTAKAPRHVVITSGPSPLRPDLESDR